MATPTWLEQDLPRIVSILAPFAYFGLHQILQGLARNGPLCHSSDQYGSRPILCPCRVPEGPYSSTLQTIGYHCALSGAITSLAQT